jgi:DNA invertase Pin-like site-specific DNA recombinase
MQRPKGKHPTGTARGQLRKDKDLHRLTQNKRAGRPKVSMREALVVLRNMEKGTGTIDALERAAHISRATVYRLLSDCEHELGVRFNYHAGTYSVRDWGLLSRRRVLR